MGKKRSRIEVRTPSVQVKFTRQPTLDELRMSAVDAAARPGAVVRSNQFALPSEGRGHPRWDEAWFHSLTPEQLREEAEKTMERIASGEQGVDYYKR